MGSWNPSQLKFYFSSFFGLDYVIFLLFIPAFASLRNPLCYCCLFFKPSFILERVTLNWNGLNCECRLKRCKSNDSEETSKSKVNPCDSFFYELWFKRIKCQLINLFSLCSSEYLSNECPDTQESSHRACSWILPPILISNRAETPIG